MLHYLKMVK